MPRPVEESRFRRFLMQSIMWLVLGATIAAAALVDRARQRALVVTLGPRLQLGEFSIRLPQDWDELQDMQGGPNRIVRRDPTYGDILFIATRPRSIREIFSLGDDEAEEHILVGDLKLPLIVSRDMEREQMSVRVTRPLPSGRLLTISVVIDEIDQRQLQHEKELIKQIAASVQVGSQN